MATTQFLIEVEVDEKGAVKDLNKVDDGLEKVDKTAKETSKSTEKVAKGFGRIKVGALAAVAGLLALGKGLLKTIELAGEQEQAEAQLNAVLESTGEAAGLASKELTDLAASLQETSTFGDEAIIRGEALLLTFTSIGKDVFPAATQTMLDMSTAMGTGLKESAIQLGKALNDPVLGISALSRVGVSFTQDQKNVIKSLVEMGDVAGAQTIILEELNKEFGGQAAAAADTMKGSMEQGANAMGDAGEAIGTLLAPAVIRVSKALKTGAEFASQFFGILQGSETTQTEFEQRQSSLALLLVDGRINAEMYTSAIAALREQEELSIEAKTRLAEINQLQLEQELQFVEDAPVRLEMTEAEIEALNDKFDAEMDATEAAKKHNEMLEAQAFDLENVADATDELTDAQIAQTEAVIATGIAHADSADDIKDAARNSIKAILAQAIATQIGKAIASIPFPFNIIAAPVAGVAIGVLLENALPQFQDGTNFAGGGLSLVGERGPELLDVPRGSRITPAAQTQSELDRRKTGDIFIDFRGALVAADANAQLAAMVEEAINDGLSNIGLVIDNG